MDRGLGAAAPEGLATLFAEISATIKTQEAGGTDPMDWRQAAGLALTAVAHAELRIDWK